MQSTSLKPGPTLAERSSIPKPLRVSRDRWCPEHPWYQSTCIAALEGTDQRTATALAMY
jgi:hypothetical protein